jgi:hypothetical protein
VLVQIDALILRGTVCEIRYRLQLVSVMLAAAFIARELKEIIDELLARDLALLFRIVLRIQRGVLRVEMVRDACARAAERF